MSNRKQFPLLLFLITLTGCATGLSRRVLISPLDGAWRLSGIDCSKGVLSDKGMIQKKEILNGSNKNLSVVTGDLVQGLMYFTRKTEKEYSELKCEVNYIERWSPNADQSTLVISETKMTATPVSGTNSWCQGLNKEGARIHSYSLTNDTLRMTLSESYSGDNICPWGKEVLIYRKVY